MRKRPLSRRTLLKGSAVAAAGLFASPLRAALPEPSAVTPALVAAAKREGRVIVYTSMDLQVAERLAKAFQAAYPGIAVRLERSGAERVFRRIEREMQARIRAMDIVNSADAANFLVWKRNGWLEPYLPEQVAQHFPAAYRDPDGLYVTSRIWLATVGYNTKLVAAEDAPRSFADLLDPKWNGRMVKAHPAYSGVVLTATFQIVRDLGWDYLEKLARQNVLQMQSSIELPRRLLGGDRPVMIDGNDYNVIQMKERGQPVEVVYPTEGTPLITGPTGLFASAPNPNAGRLFHSWLHSRETQQMLVDAAAQHSAHAQVQEKPGRRRLSEIKVMATADPAEVEKASAEIKARYTKLFGT